MSLDFNGCGIDVYGGLDSDQGMFQVLLDGEEVAVIDTYAEKRVGSQGLYSAHDLEPGDHTIKLVLLEEKNEASSDCMIRIDAFRIMEN